MTLDELTEALVGRTFTMRVRQPDRPPRIEQFGSEHDYKVALAQFFGVGRCDECGDETGECDCA